MQYLYSCDLTNNSQSKLGFEKKIIIPRIQHYNFHENILYWLYFLNAVLYTLKAIHYDMINYYRNFITDSSIPHLYDHRKFFLLETIIIIYVVGRK